MFVRLKRVAIYAIAAAALTGGISALSPGVASAASYNGVCGPGYTTIDHHDLGNLGTVWLTFNSSTGNNCVVTVRNNPGTRMHMNALVSLAGQPWIEDPGNYTTYAGPVYVHAPHACIDWGGEIGNIAWYAFNTHCG